MGSVFFDLFAVFLCWFLYSKKCKSYVIFTVISVYLGLRYMLGFTVTIGTLIPFFISIWLTLLKFKPLVDVSFRADKNYLSTKKLYIGRGTLGISIIFNLISFQVIILHVLSIIIVFLVYFIQVDCLSLIRYLNPNYRISLGEICQQCVQAKLIFNVLTTMIMLVMLVLCIYRMRQIKSSVADYVFCIVSAIIFQVIYCIYSLEDFFDVGSDYTTTPVLYVFYLIFFACYYVCRIMKSILYYSYADLDCIKMEVCSADGVISEGLFVLGFTFKNKLIKSSLYKNKIEIIDPSCIDYVKLQYDKLIKYLRYDKDREMWLVLDTI